MIKLLIAIKRSIFLRLLIIFILTIILLFTLIIFTVHHLNDSPKVIKNKFTNNIAQYASLLIRQIGSPPDIKVAQKLSDELGLHIKIRSTRINWQSSDFVFTNLGTPIQQKRMEGTIFKLGHYRGYSYVQGASQAHETTFIFSHRFFDESKGAFLLLVILILIFVISICYLLVRWLFKPLRSLSQGVTEVSEGHLDFRLETKRQDEFGHLARAFNTMSDQIQSMMTEKEQLLLDVSHELRSPITRMKMALELDDTTKSKTSIQEDLREMESMIKELLESARLKSPNSCLSKKQIYLNDFLTRLIKDYEYIKPGIIFSSPDNNLVLVVDHDRLLICMRNLIDNALTYSNQQSKPIIINVKESKKFISISVIDFGIGIPEKDQEHLFEPFYRIDKSRNIKTGGYGLGLHLCKNIVNAHGGVIHLNSKENEQTSITLEFPKTKHL